MTVATELLERPEATLRSKAGYTIAGLLVAQISWVLLFVLMARVTGPATFGRIAVALAAAALITDVVDFGANTRLLRDFASGRDVGTAHRRILTTKVTVGTAIAVVWAVAVLAVGTPDAPALALLGAYVPLMLLSAGMLIPSRAAGRAGVAAAVTTVERAVALAAAALLLMVLPAAVAFAGGIVAGASTAALAAWMYCPARLRTPSWGGHAEAARLYLSSRHFGVPALLSDLRLLDTAVVAAVAGPVAAGLFAVPARVTGPLGIIATGFSTTVLQHVAARGDRPGVRGEVLRGLGTMLGVVTALLLATGMAAPELIPRLLGPAYGAAVLPLQVVCAGMVLASLNQPMAQLLQAVGAESVIRTTLAIAAVLGLAAVAAGAHLGNATGAAAAFAAMQAFIAIRLALPFRKALLELAA